MQEPKSDFIISGDLHGNLDQAKLLTTKAFDLDLDTIVQLGDFGSTYQPKFLDTLQRYLQAFNINFYFVDGNHENFDYLYSLPIIEDGTRQVRDNIYHLPRGFRFIWKDLSFMAMGGAASINKQNLRNWSEEEAITLENIQQAELAGKSDIMFTHDSPIEAPNSICDSSDKVKECFKKYSAFDNLYANLHRVSLQKVVDIIQPKMLFHGHYHKRMSYKYKRANGEWIKVIGLDQGSHLTTYNSTFTFSFNEAKASIERLKVKNAVI